MLKKTEVIMLSTNQKAQICLNYQELTLHQTQLINCLNSWQHLYFLDSEPLKQGESAWCINKNRDTLYYIEDAKSEDCLNWDRVIASSDESLKWSNDNNIQILDYHFAKLPQPSQSFIEKYITEYNKGNVIEWVNVEYETITKRYGSCSKGEGITMDVTQLKIDKNNTITIKKIKDSWNREEVIEILKKFDTDTEVGRFNGPTIRNNWIENNI